MTCNTLKRFLYTRLCYSVSWILYKLYVRLLFWSKLRKLEFKNIYVSLIAVQIYMWFNFEVSEGARKVTLCSEYSLLREARQGHM